MIGIVGNGFVGNAIYRGLKNKVPVKVYDLLPQKSKNTLSEVLESKIIFVCLPTPMQDDGNCDLTSVSSFFDSIESHHNALFVIKSTVPIGTTDSILNRRMDLRVVHSPEFLTAHNAVEDFENADRCIIGGKSEFSFELKEFMETYYPKVPVHLVSSNESEAIKYFSNTFLALKVTMFNSFYEVCKKLNLDYESVREGVCADSRIGKSHTKVPGIDGKLGFGGMCFPKDVNALIKTLNSSNIDSTLYSTFLEYNNKIRLVNN